MHKTSSVTDFKLHSNFEKLRQRLLTDETLSDRLEKPLAYWALPNDRRLPLAFMHRSLKDLLATDFHDLFATPGVGRKKINSLLVLLSRAASGAPPSREDEELEEELKAKAASTPKVNLENIDPLDVSEEEWAKWQECVVRTGYDHLPLGRFAPSLRQLPRVLWYTPLSTYTNLSLGEIRNLKTHGEKRVAALIEVFGSLYRIVRSLNPQPELAVKIVPRIASELEEWIYSIHQRRIVPTEDEIRHRFIRPLLVQTRIDGGANIEELCTKRIGIDGRAYSVKKAAEELRLTRARVYQLLADVAEMMRVRWPDGVRQMQALKEDLLKTAKRPGELDEFVVAVDLFFPTKEDEEEE